MTPATALRRSLYVRLMLADRLFVLFAAFAGLCGLCCSMARNTKYDIAMQIVKKIKDSICKSKMSVSYCAFDVNGGFLTTNILVMMGNLPGPEEHRAVPS